jgi:hypothetical protein
VILSRWSAFPAALAALAALSLTTVACSEGNTATPTDAAPSAPDGSAIEDAGTADVGHQFIEEFDDTTQIDLANTTATFDRGRALAPSYNALENDLFLNGGAAATGDAVFHAHGNVEMRAGLIESQTGGVYIRAYGSVLLDRVEVRAGPGKPVIIEAEGDILIENSRVIASGVLADLVIRTRDRLFITNGSSIVCGSAARCVFEVEDEMQLDLASSIDTGNESKTDVEVLAGRLNVLDDSTIDTNDTSFGVPAGDISIRTADLLEVQNSELTASDGGCVAGGDITIASGGEIQLSNACFRGGDWVRDPGKPVCTNGPGGNVHVRYQDFVSLGDPRDGCELGGVGGTGNPAGEVVFEHADLTVDAHVDMENAVVVTSLPIDETFTVAAQEATLDIDPGARAVVQISPDGSEAGFAPIHTAVGRTLARGWRFRAILTARMFSGVALDRLVLSY